VTARTKDLLAIESPPTMPLPCIPHHETKSDHAKCDQHQINKTNANKNSSEHILELHHYTTDYVRRHENLFVAS